MRFAPLYDRVIVRPLKKHRTKGGLYVPQVAQGNTPFANGEVLEVGAGRVLPDGKTLPTVVKAGDIVVYDRGGATAIPYGDEEVVVMNEPTILGILHGVAVSSLTDVEGRGGLVDDTGRPVDLQ